MTADKLIEIIVTALKKEEKIKCFKKYHRNNAVQIMDEDGDIYNMMFIKVLKDGYIIVNKKENFT